MRNLARQVPGLDPGVVLKHGALKIMNSVPPQCVDDVKTAFNQAIVDVFYLALAMTCVTFVGAFLIEWKSVRNEKVMGERKENGDVIQLVELNKDGERVQPAEDSNWERQ